jgi:hypothetical protein
MTTTSTGRVRRAASHSVCAAPGCVLVVKPGCPIVRVPGRGWCHLDCAGQLATEAPERP